MVRVTRAEGCPHGAASTFLCFAAIIWEVAFARRGGHHPQKLLTTSHAAKDAFYVAAEVGGL